MTQTGTATRPISFGFADSDKVVRNIRTFPAGTEVYIGRTRRDVTTVRVCGTLFTQDVYLDSSVEL